MKTQLANWGNSLAVRIPKHVARAARLKNGDDLEVSADGPGTVKIKKAKKRGITSKELVSKITPENRHAETDWGTPVGKELW